MKISIKKQEDVKKVRLIFLNTLETLQEFFKLVFHTIWNVTGQAMDSAHVFAYLN